MDLQNFKRASAKKIIQSLEIKEDQLRTIINNTNNAVRNFPPADAEQALIGALYLCTALYMGVKKDRTPDEIYQAGAQFILNNFGFLSIADIKQAFELAAAKRLQVDLKAYYGTFDIEAIGELLNAYKLFRNTALNAVQSAIKKEQQRQQEEAQKEMKNADARAAFCAEVLKWVAMAKEEIPPFDTWQEIPAAKVTAAFESEALKLDGEIKKQIWKQAGLEAVKKMRQEKAQQVAAGLLSAGHVKQFLDDIKNGIEVKGLQEKRKVIYAQLLLWHFVKPQ